MIDSTPHILLLESYFGGSHRAFLEGLQKNLPFRFSLVSLPARKWKMRMQLAAPWMADKTVQMVKNGARFDAILCSTFIDVATLRTLLAKEGVTAPVAMYFHENQFAYPNRVKDPAWFQFAALNFTSALAADSIAFNSKYNYETFLEGVAGYLKKAVDMDVINRVEELRRKSVVLHPGIDFTDIDAGSCKCKSDLPVLVWNHRWEHDKDPDTFFKGMQELSESGMDFNLIVLGQHFEHCPGIFAKAKKALHEHILHFGYAADRKEYINLLCQGDFIVSTAIHEFFGISVLEAVRCGCWPIVPDRLSYQELFPKRYRYGEGKLTGTIAANLKHPANLKKKETHGLTDSFSWKRIAERYYQWFMSFL